ncbi:Uncharacterized protein FKW44_012233 [Caligus rogercresseyi]|uniref:Medium-chain acyl-CoA ligase ACSF2, mitochondrial n=1 Tax=Caligus rogercresseyi TaxID=217165 RepID=A0A7T8HJE2_CALRO|nr:Uncharacterized protein FKW44_012233 [Caligus rogercresseyi]
MAEQKNLNMNVSSVYKALSGGALFLSEASSLFEKHLNTETIYDPLDLRVNTVGPPFSHVEAKIVDQNGKILPVNTPGELWVRTPGLMHGYYEDEKANKKSIGMDRYYHSALMTEKVYCKIIGRIDDMVIRGGENLYPKEIEDILSKHPNVLETYIVVVPDDKMGEELCAWIHLEEGAKEFDIPKYCIYVTEFPKTLSGKVKKFELKATSIEILLLNSNYIILAHCRSAAGARPSGRVGGLRHSIIHGNISLDNMLRQGLNLVSNNEVFEAYDDGDVV